jgi:fatty-acyl-CoA synthase
MVPPPSNLLAMLRRTAELSPTAYVRFTQGGEEVERFTAASLLEYAGRLASGLRNHARVEPGQRVALILPTVASAIGGLFGIVAAGAVPVPLPPPLPFSNPDRYVERVRGAVAKSKIRLILGPDELGSFLETMESSLGPGVSCSAIPPLLEREPAWHEPKPEDAAMVQYTSGSTSAPKGVVLKHRNLISNLEAIRRGLALTREDHGCVWLPLFHDMGLIGCVLTPLYAGAKVTLLPPEDFVLSPELWLTMIGRLQATIAPAPNAAYLHCVKRVKGDALNGLDLSSWRAAMLGAEAIDPGTVRRFTEHFRSTGFRPEAMMPVYGMAEAALAVTFSPVERGMRTAWVRRSLLARGEVEPVEPGHADGREIVALGGPVYDTEIRLVEADGAPLAPNAVGEIQVRGGSVMDGYDQDEGASRAAFRDGWLATGDLGFLHEGELYVVGRIKETIIVGGQNLYATDIEHLASHVPGVGTQSVMALGVQGDGSEALVVLVETREENEERRSELAASIRSEISTSLGAPSQVILVERGSIPRTSSGKLERHKGLALYEQLTQPRAGNS